MSKVAYVGNRTNLASDGKSYNTERHIHLSLEKLGHTVDFIQENEIKPGTLPDRVEDADLFLWTRTWPGFVTEQELEKISIPTVSYHLDKYSDIKRDGGVGRDPFWKTDHVFSPEGSSQAARIFKTHGINHHYLPAGVYDDECEIVDPVQKFKHDIVFVGGGEEYLHPEWRYRGELMRFLKRTYGNRFAKYGHPQPFIRGKELNQLYSSAKVVIGDSLCKDFTDSYYFSDRLFEVPGRGGFQIAPYIPGVTDYYKDREEIVLYSFGNWTQLKNLIDYYLTHDDEREAVRKAGHGRTKREHTYTHRVKEMLNTVYEQEQEKAVANGAAR